MKKEYKLSFLTIVALVFSTSLVQAQQLTVHDPQVHYDEAGGLYDKDIVRSMFVDFENPGYHGIPLHLSSTTHLCEFLRLYRWMTS